MSATTTSPRPADPGVLDALSLLAEVADELVVRTVRDTHLAWTDRVHGIGRRVTGATGASVGEVLHRGIAGAVYGGLGAGLRAASRGLDAVAAHRRRAPARGRRRRGRFLSSAVNGLIGDRLERRAAPAGDPDGGARGRPRRGRSTATPSPRRTPTPTGGSWCCCTGSARTRSSGTATASEVGTTYAESLAAQGWTPVLLRANTGLSLRENGVALTALLQRLVEEWPAEVTRIALVGHSMGGLVMRAAACRRDRGRGALDRPGLRRRHARRPAPRRPAGGVRRPRQQGARPAAGGRGVRTDPRPALGRRARPRRRAWPRTCRRCRTRATGSSRPR